MFLSKRTPNWRPVQSCRALHERLSGVKHPAGLVGPGFIPPLCPRSVGTSGSESMRLLRVFRVVRVARLLRRLDARTMAASVGIGG